jgi:dolichyl-phosphate beta-glucosyltransferase
MIKLSVIIPAYNEEKRISLTLREVDAYLEKQGYTYEIIVVDNGSKDQTMAVVDQLSKTTVQNCRAIEQPPVVVGNNKGNAVKRGIMEAQGQYMVFMDADNATPISEIEKFFPYLEQGLEMVIGSRYLDPSTVKIRQPFYKVVLSRMSNILIQFVLGVHIKDTQTGFKAFNGKAAKEIFKHLSIYGWGFDMELIAIAYKLSYRVKEVPISWEEHGGSHVPLKAYLQSLRDLFKIKWNSLTGKYSPK